MNPKLSFPTDPEKIDIILTRLSKAVKELKDPLVTSISKTRKDPFLILIATILSLRTKDELTYKASQLLFSRADTPVKMLAIPLVELEQIIFSVGFYRQKARTIHEICKR
ncbi:MAG: endonuclease III domain-containing protein, partial [Candidatus Hodarchaeota archaeon]